MKQLETIKQKLEEKGIYYAEDQMLDRPSVIGYEKKFKWSWFATQLNTFMVASDFTNTVVDVPLVEKQLSAAFEYTQKHYSGWPRGVQSGIAVIAVVLSDQVDEEVITYCEKLKSGKKWAAFTIPVVVNTQTGNVYQFRKKPMWGAIYYPHFRKLIDEIVK